MRMQVCKKIKIKCCHSVNWQPEIGITVQYLRLAKLREASGNQIQPCITHTEGSAAQLRVGIQTGSRAITFVGMALTKIALTLAIGCPELVQL